MIAKIRKPKSSISQSSGEKLFAGLVASYAATNPDVECVTLFGFNCLRTRGKVFTKFHRDQVVLKLPAERIAALIGAGHLRPYQRGRGLGMKEWAVVTSDQEELVFALAEESRTFVCD